MKKSEKRSMLFSESLRISEEAKSRAAIPLISGLPLDSLLPNVVSDVDKLFWNLIARMDTDNLYIQNAVAYFRELFYQSPNLYDDLALEYKHPFNPNRHWEETYD